MTDAESLTSLPAVPEYVGTAVVNPASAGVVSVTVGAVVSTPTIELQRVRCAREPEVVARDDLDRVEARVGERVVRRRAAGRRRDRVRRAVAPAPRVGGDRAVGIDRVPGEGDRRPGRAGSPAST